MIKILGLICRIFKFSFQNIVKVVLMKRLMRLHFVNFVNAILLKITILAPLR